MLHDHDRSAGATARARSPSLFSRWQRAALVGLAACLLGSSPATSQEDPTPNVSFNGFGTVGVVYASEDLADFVAHTTRPHGPGHTEKVSPDPDTRLGAQVTAAITPELTAIVQVVSEQRADGTYEPQLEWANVRYDFTPNFNVRAGRMVLPIFLVSDHRKVSYANPWVRPPVELYSLVPVFTLDGVEASYRWPLEDWNAVLTASYGRSEVGFPGAEEGEELTAESEDAVHLVGRARRAGLTLHAAYGWGVLDIDAFDPFFDAFRRFGAEGVAIAERFQIDDTPFQSGSVGLEYDPGPWFGMAELGWIDTHSALGERLGGYASGGWRIGRLTPYATYGRMEVLSSTSAAGLSLSGLPPELAQRASRLNTGLNRFLRAIPIQQTLSIGGRWEMAAGVAVKLQVDFVDVLEDSPGTFINRQPGFERGGSARVVSLATTFVF